MKEILEYIISILLILIMLVIIALAMPEHWFTKEWFRGIKEVFGREERK
jgi:hypothetical protein